MTVESFYQANILEHKNPVFVALQTVSLDGEKKVPGMFYFTFVSLKALNDAELDSEEFAAEVVAAERNDYALYINGDMEEVYESHPIFASADAELTGEWKLASELKIK